MEKLFSTFYQQIERTELKHIRYNYPDIRWENRLIAIVGSRGTGKTTLLFQYIKQNFAPYSTEALYVSLDNLWFTNHTLLDLADDFYKLGGKALFIDEVHKYPTWSREIKNIYDSYPDLKVVFTGSSLLEILKGEADLSRRAIVYQMHGMSFREFLDFDLGYKMTPIALDEIIKHHVEIAMEIKRHLKPIVEFNQYTRYGYFPFYFEDKILYHERLLATLNVILEVDLPSIERIDFASIHKIKKLFAILATLVPYSPNISKLSADVGVTRVSLHNYLYFLQKAQAILLLEQEASGMRQMTKPEKIYLGNTNYAYALGGEQADIGNIRETFFFNQVKVKNSVTYSPDVDFLVNDSLNFEIGGKNKTQKQIKSLPNSFLALDNIEVGFGNQIPLWMFGLSY